MVVPVDQVWAVESTVVDEDDTQLIITVVPLREYNVGEEVFALLDISKTLNEI